MLRNRSPWNVLVYFGFTFLTGLILAPILLGITYESGSFDVVVQAFVLTTSIFVGLSVFVVVSRKDFSFLGGGLMIALFTLLGLGIVSIIFRTESWAWPSPAWPPIVFSGFILYDTSRILRHAGQMSPVSGGAEPVPGLLQPVPGPSAPVDAGASPLTSAARPCVETASLQAAGLAVFSCPLTNLLTALQVVLQ